MAGGIPLSSKPTGLNPTASQSVQATQEKATSEKPAITQAPKNANPNAVHPKGSTLIKMISGSRQGLRAAHNVAVLDLTSDRTQFLPYMAHCDTCAWEGRFVNVALAEGAAMEHAGK